MKKWGGKQHCVPLSRKSEGSRAPCPRGAAVYAYMCGNVNAAVVDEHIKCFRFCSSFIEHVGNALLTNASREWKLVRRLKADDDENCTSRALFHLLVAAAAIQ